MKSTGIVRCLDKLNRIVIPREIIRTHNLENASMEIFTEGENIIIRKYVSGCLFCGEMDGLIEVNSKNICPACVKEISRRRANP